MLNPAKKKISIYESIIYAFMLFWVGFILLDYLNKHPTYLESFVHFRYFKLLGFFILYGGFFSWFLSTEHKKMRRWSNVLFLPFLMLSFFILLLSMALAYSKYYFMPLDVSGYFIYLSNAFQVCFIGLFILFSLYSFGLFLTKRFLVKKVFKKSNPVIELAIGMMAFTFILIPLAAFHLLYPFVIIPILIFFYIMEYPFWVYKIKNIGSIKPDFNRLQYLMFYGILIFAALNFVFILSAFPLGFDSRNYYVNLALLTADNHGFVKGFQPHNWELFTAIGKVVSGKNEMVLFLSYVAGILSAWATYHLARWFDIPKTTSILLAFFLIATPAVSHQMFIELKVDLGLLFLQLSTVLLFLNHQKFQKNTDSYNWSFIIVIGLLFGYGLGVKLLHFFLIFGIFCAMAARLENKPLLFAIWSLGLGIVLVLRLDNHTGLRSLHPHVDWISYLFLLVGTGLIIYSMLKDYNQIKNICLQMTFILSITILSFSPWMIKSYTESPSNDILRIIKGNSPGHIIDLNKMKELFNQSQSK